MPEPEAIPKKEDLKIIPGKKRKYKKRKLRQLKGAGLEKAPKKKKDWRSLPRKKRSVQETPAAPAPHNQKVITELKKRIQALEWKAEVLLDALKKFVLNKDSFL